MVLSQPCTSEMIPIQSPVRRPHSHLAPDYVTPLHRSPPTQPPHRRGLPHQVHCTSTLSTPTNRSACNRRLSSTMHESKNDLEAAPHLPIIPAVGAYLPHLSAAHHESPNDIRPFAGTQESRFCKKNPKMRRMWCKFPPRFGNYEQNQQLSR